MSKKNFDSKLEHLYDMLSFIETHCQKKHFTPSILNKIILAAEEALVNIIEYSYPSNQAGIIKITCEDSMRKPGIKILIEDHGIPFNPIAQTLDNCFTLKEDETRIGGYGIYIFVGVMDCVEYQRLEEGNSLTLIKYL